MKQEATKHYSGEARAQTGRSYAKPELRAYGSLAELTRTVGSMTVGDSGAPPFVKTA